MQHVPHANTRNTRPNKPKNIQSSSRLTICIKSVVLSSSNNNTSSQRIVSIQSAIQKQQLQMERETEQKKNYPNKAAATTIINSSESMWTTGTKHDDFAPIGFYVTCKWCLNQQQSTRGSGQSRTCSNVRRIFFLPIHEGFVIYF